MEFSINEMNTESVLSFLCLLFNTILCLELVNAYIRRLGLISNIDICEVPTTVSEFTSITIGL